MSSGAGQTSGSLLAVGCNLRKVCNRSLERLSAIAFSFEGKCCAEKEKLFTAAVQVNVLYLLDFFCSGIQFNLLLSPYPCFISLLYLDLYVLGDDALIS